MITERNFKVQAAWVYKSTFYLTIYTALPFLIMKGLAGLFAVIFFGIIFIFSDILRLETFHYSLEEEFLVFRQGIFSREERHIPYRAVQNILIQRDLYDRFFGLTSLIVENASQEGGVGVGRRDKNLTRHWFMEGIGSEGNRVIIPGLTWGDSEKLKEVILQKVQKVSSTATQSGL